MIAKLSPNVLTIMLPCQDLFMLIFIVSRICSLFTLIEQHFLRFENIIQEALMTKCIQPLCRRYIIL